MSISVVNTNGWEPAAGRFQHHLACQVILTRREGLAAHGWANGANGANGANARTRERRERREHFDRLVATEGRHGSFRD